MPASMRARLAVAAGLLACAACGPGTVDLHETWSLAPGVTAEVNLLMDPDTSAEARFQASGVLAWDVHRHEGREVIVEQQGASDAGTLVLSTATGGKLSFAWRNGSAEPITLEVRVSGQGHLVSAGP
ncbi:MAG: hypothetical protein ACK4N5_11495 [Myxococcales bacterium]